MVNAATLLRGGEKPLAKIMRAWVNKAVESVDVSEVVALTIDGRSFKQVCAAEKRARNANSVASRQSPKIDAPKRENAENTMSDGGLDELFSTQNTANPNARMLTIKVRILRPLESLKTESRDYSAFSWPYQSNFRVTNMINAVTANVHSAPIKSAYDSTFKTA